MAKRERAVGLSRLARALQLSSETGHDAAQLLDRLSHRGLSSADAVSPVVLAATLLISAEQGASCKRPAARTVSCFHVSSVLHAFICRLWV